MPDSSFYQYFRKINLSEIKWFDSLSCEVIQLWLPAKVLLKNNTNADNVGKYLRKLRSATNCLASMTAIIQRCQVRGGATRLKNHIRSGFHESDFFILQAPRPRSSSHLTDMTHVSNAIFYEFEVISGNLWLQKTLRNRKI